MRYPNVYGIDMPSAHELIAHNRTTQDVADLARLHRWKPDQVQGLRLKFNDLFDAPRTSWEIAQHLGENQYYARDWTRTHGNLYRSRYRPRRSPCPGP